MLKTIKTKKQMRLDELIKYIYNENIESKTFTDLKNEVEVSTNIFGSVSITNNNNSKLFVSHNRLFTVEIEEPITEDTVLEDVQEFFFNKTQQKIYTQNYGESSIKSVFDVNKVATDDIECLRIYALLDGELKLVWKRTSKDGTSTPEF